MSSEHDDSKVHDELREAGFGAPLPDGTAETCDACEPKLLPRYDGPLWCTRHALEFARTGLVADMALPRGTGE